MHLIDISPLALELSERDARPAPARLGRRPPRDLRGGAAARGASSAPATARCSSSSSARTSATSTRRPRTTSSRRSAAPCGPGDALLLGADLVKPEAELLLAYDDPLGVTAAFNKNLLVRMNTELLADFDLDRVRPSRRLERRGVAASRCTSSRERPQERPDPPRRHARSRFEQGELIWTESSYKYTPEEVIALLGREAGFRSVEQWIDAGRPVRPDALRAPMS